MPAPGWQSIYGSTAQSIAQQYGVPSDLFSNVITIESGWQPYVVSPAGAVGLGQLMPATATSLNVNAWDPVDNLRGAAAYLRSLYNKFGNWPQAVAAYNPNQQTYAASVLSGVNAAGQQVAPNIAAEFTNPTVPPTSASTSPTYAPGFMGDLARIIDGITAAAGLPVAPAPPSPPASAGGANVVGLPSASGASLLLWALAAAGAIVAIVVIVRK